ncbi:MAG: hypothetical protein WD894_20145 [Pirellulales bacterium]
MNSYRTVLKVTEPGQIILNVPYPPGELVEVVVRPRPEDRQELTKQIRDLLKETQNLPQVQAITDEDIAAEIEAYRKGL